MAGRGTGPDFVEALARGLDVLACFDANRPAMTLSEVLNAPGATSSSGRAASWTPGAAVPARA